MSSDSVTIALPVDLADATMLELCSIFLHVNKKKSVITAYKYMFNGKKKDFNAIMNAEN